MTKQPTHSLDSTQESRLEATRRNLESREDIIGQSYRTIRDHPRASAAIAGGVVAAAGAGAFLLNRRKSQIGTATGHASSSEQIDEAVAQMNEDAVSELDEGRNESMAEQSKTGAVAY
ncbi:hypothetical protein [Sphingomicrobium astaxanthinifaciens]|uniref:hypothetical protein n=1 Tax=Sphingomicrobium astaxanthinifaciens TaxID=1227949 RepID=UPI001FCBFEDB|nr:hypothetical protein [Sphingomicrobium astaxanthinifaciens]MCJ7422289.1 hypothetical protein [Sphingomicrobium astaxanthinifaciens]